MPIYQSDHSFDITKAYCTLCKFPMIPWKCKRTKDSLITFDFHGVCVYLISIVKSVAPYLGCILLKHSFISKIIIQNSKVVVNWNQVGSIERWFHNNNNKKSSTYNDRKWVESHNAVKEISYMKKNMYRLTLTECMICSFSQTSQLYRKIWRFKKDFCTLWILLNNKNS